LKIALIVLICSALMVTAYVAVAQNSGPAPSIGSVDIDQVMAQYDKAKSATAELSDMATKFDKQLKWMGQHALLNESEITELVKLYTKDKPTPEEQTRIAALEDLDKQQETKLRTLQNIATPTAPQKQQLDDLQKLASSSVKAIEMARKDFQKQVNARNDELTVSVGKDIKDAVAVVSQGKNVSVVVNKSIVIQGGTDLTEDVIKKLNTK
jgi:Skp family chaperone for outer membrane proteins